MNEPRIISEGEKWSIGDQLDGSIVMTFDSWNTPDPEARAREMFAAYPRMSNLWVERVVKYEKDLVAAKPHPDDALRREPVPSREIVRRMTEVSVEQDALALHLWDEGLVRPEEAAQVVAEAVLRYLGDRVLEHAGPWNGEIYEGVTVWPDGEAHGYGAAIDEVLELLGQPIPLPGKTSMHEGTDHE